MKQKAQNITLALRAMLAFTLAYKLVTWLVFRPLLGLFLQLMLRLSGYQLAFNDFMLGFLFTLPGLLAALVLLAGAAVFTWVEFSALIHLAAYHLRGMRPTLGAVLRRAFSSLRLLRGPGALGFCIYTLALLPLANLGLVSSLLPALSIPNFIVGELSKTPWGALLLFGFAVLTIALFLATLFTLPCMVLGRQRFGAALKAGRRLGKSSKRLAPRWLGFLLIWGLLFAAPSLVLLRLFGTESVGPAQIIAVFGFSWQSLLLGLLALLVWLAGVLLVPAGLLWLVWQYTRLTGYNPPPLAADEIAEPFRFNHLLRLRGSKYYRLVKRVLVVTGSLALAWGLVRLLYQPPALHQPIVLGHRGSAYGVENTLEALEGAILAGAEYAEVDILLSADGVPMVVHDTNLGRLAGQSVNVYDLTAAQLSALSLSQNGYNGHISPLREVVAYCRGRIGLAIELKTHGHEEESLVDAIMQVVNEYEYADSCIFLSLDYTLLEELKQKYPETTAGYCVYGRLGNLTAGTLMSMSIDFVVVEESMASSEAAWNFRAAWLPAYVWTVNDPASMRAYLDMGFIGIVTDHPGTARTAIEEYLAHSYMPYLDEAEWRE